MRWYTPPNHASAIHARREIEATMTKEAREGRLAGPFTREQVYEQYGFFRTNPMGSAVNGDGSIRLINDLSHLGRIRQRSEVPSRKSRRVGTCDFRLGESLQAITSSSLST